MKWPNKFFSRSSWQGFILIIVILIFVSYAVAHNKTVVIPLFDSELSTPQTQYFTVGSEAFVPWKNVDYVNAGGNGGAYVDAAGGQALVAPVHLPHGAEVTEFEVFFDDTSIEDMTVYLNSQYFSSGYAILAAVNSSGTGGKYSEIDTTILSPIVDNKLKSYLVYAFSTNWNSSLKIKGAVITYTIEQAP